MAKHILILGSTGLLGQALTSTANAKGYKTTGIARKNAPINLDATDHDQLLSVLKTLKPDIIINTAANVNLANCEEHPKSATAVNADISKYLSGFCADHGIKYVYISTDHFYSGGNNDKHDENHEINICNQYALTKRLGEQYSLKNKESLVVRTNIVGFRGQKNNPTFVEWAIGSLENKKPINLFTDCYTSSIDVTNFALLLLELIENKSKGVYNLACSDVVNKSTFITALAQKIGLPLENSNDCKMLDIPSVLDRNESLGLDVSKVEKALNRSMPSFDEVINSLASEYMKDR